MLLNKRQVARLFGVSTQTVDRWVKAGKLPEPNKNLFSARWDYEEVAALVKFRSKL